MIKAYLLFGFLFLSNKHDNICLKVTLLLVVSTVVEVCIFPLVISEAGEGERSALRGQQCCVGPCIITSQFYNSSINSHYFNLPVIVLEQSQLRTANDGVHMLSIVGSNNGYVDQEVAFNFHFTLHSLRRN